MADTPDQEPANQPEPVEFADPLEETGLTEAEPGADPTPDADSALPGPEIADDTQQETEPAPALRRNGKPKRISRWDRPPEPHDWRWIVGHVGRALITAGLLMFGFVGYQVWGTGIQTARAQNALDREFNEFIEENGITPGTLAPPPSVTTAPAAIESTESTVPAGSTVPTDTATPDSGSTDSATTEAAELATTVLPTTAAPVVQDYGDINPGDALAKLVIPSIGVDWNVVAGVSVKDLAKGPGHFPDTPLPGQLGNSAIAGHRTGHGGPFIDLDKLKPGDEIQVYTQLGDAYAYIVTDSVVVAPNEYRVITDSDPTVATLTLVTCTPKYESTKRLVVHATLDPTRSAPVGLPSIFYDQDEPILVDPVLPADETTVTAPMASTASDSGADVSGSTETTSAQPAPVTAATASSPAATDQAAAVSESDEFAEEDAFSQGWFDDGRALPHVAGWAAVLALIGYGAFRVAKRFRRLYLAFLVGFVPFVFALYFFYENVNRLLPAAI